MPGTLALALGLLLAASTPLSAQGLPPGAALPAFAAADDSLVLSTGRIRFSGESCLVGQSRRPDTPYDCLSASRTLAFDLPRNRYLFTGSDPALGGYRYEYRVVLDGERGYVLDLAGSSIRGNAVRWLSPGAVRWWRAYLLGHVPAHYLSRLTPAADQAACAGSAHCVAARDETGRDVVVHASPDADGYRVLSRTVEPVFGSVTNEWRSMGLDTRSGQTLLVGYEIRQDGVVTERMRRVEFRTGVGIADEEVAIPGRYRSDVDFALPVATRRVAPGAWLIEGLGGPYARYRALLIEFEAHLMLVETPLDTATTARAVALARETVPGKPIRQIVLTHHHHDHTAGLAAALADGAHVLTTPGNLGFVQRLVRRERNADVAVETVSDRRTIRDARQHVELIVMRDASHADEILYIWLPGARLVFQGDLVNLPEFGGPPPAVALNREFRDSLVQHGIRPERILGVHGRDASWAELDALARTAP